MKKYSMTKSESETINAQVSMIGHYQQIVDALQLQFKKIMVDNVFKRLGLPEKEFELAMIDIASGVVEIPEEKDLKKEDPAVKPPSEKKS